MEIDDLLTRARRIADGGIEIVLISMGAKGLLGVTKDEAYWAVPPQVRVVSQVGAGDSALAGFIYALTKKKGLRESLILASAAGTAAVMTLGTALCKKKDVERIKKEITIEKR